MVLRKLSQSLKVGIALIVALFSTGLLPSAATYATPQTWTEETNHVEYWQDQGYGTCTKSTPTGTSYTLPGATSGTTWTLLVIKAATVNEVYMNPTAGVAYSAPLNDHGQPRDISHVISCTKTIELPQDATAGVTVTEPSCETAGTAEVTGLSNAILVGELNQSVGAHNASFTATSGHLFSNGTTSLTVSYEVNPQLDCHDETVYVTPEVTHIDQTSVCTDGQAIVTSGSITVVAKEGLHYWLNGEELIGTTQVEPGTYDITLTTVENVELTEGLTSPITVTVAPAATLSCHVQDTESVTLCHATGSESNPYVRITVSAAGAFNGHLDDNFGGTHGDHQNGQDIIPTFTYNGHTYSQNWTSESSLPENCVPAQPVMPVVCSTFTKNVSTNLNHNGWVLGEGAQYVNGGIKLSVKGNWAESTISRSFTGTLADIGTGVDFTPGTQYLGLHVTTTKGTLVYEQEPSYGGHWWSTADFGVASGMGYATFDTLENIVAANPDVMVTGLTVLYTSPTPATTTVTSVKFGCTEYMFNAVGGQGGGTPETPTTPPHVLGSTTTKAPAAAATTPQTLGTSTALPESLPATGGANSPLMIIIASLIAYGAAYFLQGRRLVGRKETVEA